MDKRKFRKCWGYFKHAEGKIQSSFIILTDESGKSTNIYNGPCRGVISNWDQFDGHKAVIWYYHERFHGKSAYQIAIDGKFVCSLNDTNNYLVAMMDDTN